MLVLWRLNYRFLLLSYLMLRYFAIPVYSHWIWCLDAILIISPRFMRLEGSSLFLDNIIDFAIWLALWLVSYRMVVWLAPLKSLAICKHGNSLWTSNTILWVVSYRMVVWLAPLKSLAICKHGNSLWTSNTILWLVSYRMVVWLAPLKSLAICKHGNSLWTSNTILWLVSYRMVVWLAPLKSLAICIHGNSLWTSNTILWLVSYRMVVWLAPLKSLAICKHGNSLWTSNTILWLVSYRMVVWLAPLKSPAICKHGDSLWTSNTISSFVWHWKFLVIIGSVNCLLPDSTMPSPGLMVTYCQMDTGRKFQQNWIKYQFFFYENKFQHAIHLLGLQCANTEAQWHIYVSLKWVIIGSDNGL